MDPMSFREKYPPEIREWWEKTLKSPRYVVAPMVDASELAWRMLSRRYKADLCFTPMLHSRIFTEDPKYQTDNLFNCVAPEDRPLIVQFCGNDADVLVKAAKLAKPYCEGIDINLGCPQKIAKNGHYGAFLMEEWDRIAEMVRRVRAEVDMPISCKIRIFPDVKKTIDYAKMLEEAGCFMLTVHGRTREQKGMDTGLADWDYIKAVRLAVNIPVVANGNIQYLHDVERCIAETGVEAVMSAEGNLHNPKLFAGGNPPVWEMGLQYLELVNKYPCPLGYSRGHLFKIYHHLLSLPENNDMRQLLGCANDLSELLDASLQLKSRYECYLNGEKTWMTPDSNPDLQKLPFPPYICQPYERPKKSDTNVSDRDGMNEQPEKKRKISLPENILSSLPPGTQLSYNRIKKMSKKPHKNWAIQRPPMILCLSCVNPQGSRCVYKLCKNCCKAKCRLGMLDCAGHRTFFNPESEKVKPISLESSPGHDEGSEVSVKQFNQTSSI